MLARTTKSLLPRWARAASTTAKKGKGKDGKGKDGEVKVPQPEGDGSVQVARGRTNFFEVAAALPQWGKGMTFAKKSWRNDKFYTLRKLRLDQTDSKRNYNRGKAWGVFHQNGFVSSGKCVKITGVHKRNWIVTEKPPAEGIPWITISDLEPERVAKKRCQKRKVFAKFRLERLERLAKRKQAAPQDGPEAAAAAPQVPA